MKYLRIAMSFKNELSEIFVEENQWRQVQYRYISAYCPWIKNDFGWWIMNCESYMSQKIPHDNILKRDTHNIKFGGFTISVGTVAISKDNCLTVEIIEGESL